MRLKKNVQPITNALNKILKTRGVSYHLNKDEIKPELLQIGFIAQELQLVFPDMVVENKNEKGDSSVLSIRYDAIIAASLEAIKEQSLILDYHEKNLERLETIAKEKGIL
jgi:hypothetical protein